MQLSRRHFFFGALALPALAAKKQAPPRPNVVLIVADELPAWMLGAYGNKEVHTPAIDRLAQTGTRFLNHFTAAPKPEPGFATLVSGRTPMQIGDAGKLGSADVALDKLLGGLGYACQAAQTPAWDETTAEAAKFIDQLTMHLDCFTHRQVNGSMRRVLFSCHAVYLARS